MEANHEWFVHRLDARVAFYWLLGHIGTENVTNEGRITGNHKCFIDRLDVRVIPLYKHV